MHIVYDSNIYLSSLVIGEHLTKLTEPTFLANFDLYASDDILRETTEVTLVKFGFSQRKAKSLEKKLRAITVIVKPSHKVHKLTYDPDNRILECCAEIQADYLVTGDKKHLLPLKTFGNTKIVTATEFLDIMGW